MEKRREPRPAISLDPLIVCEWASGLIGTPAGHLPGNPQSEVLIIQTDRFMALESSLQDASLLQLTETLVSKSDQVTFFLLLTTKTNVTFWPSRIQGFSPTGAIAQPFEECLPSYRGWRTARVTPHWSTRTLPPVHGTINYF